MFRFLVTSFLMLVAVTPALAKPRDFYSVPCNDLWAAVTDTLENPGNYAVMMMNDRLQRTSFFVIGDLVEYTDKVALVTRDGGCLMKADFVELGPDNPDFRQFRHRVERSLAKMQAEKPKPAAAEAGQLKESRSAPPQ